MLRLAILACAALAACATQPRPAAAPEPAPAQREASPAAALEDAVAAAAEARLTAAVISLETAAGQHIFEARVEIPGGFARAGRDYTVYGVCAADDLDACARKIIEGARAMERMER